ncbi:hypothetical protein, partial [Butyricicoccus pullicaecorum]|uniref:hypothetical protein n=1 Tax=Butyricicoccus pullicaecorum TaxID=501571 RepID=UPI0039907143
VVWNNIKGNLLVSNQVVQSEIDHFSKEYYFCILSSIELLDRIKQHFLCTYASSAHYAQIKILTFPLKIKKGKILCA